MKIRVAGFQMPVSEDIGRNTARICEAIDRVANEQAGILLTPEGSLSGYRSDFDVPTVRHALEQVTGVARQRGVGLALGTCFIEDDGKCHNQLRFYSPAGEYLGFHGKILRCSTLTDPPKGEINDYAVRPLRVFTFQSIIVGGLLCNDLWANPEYTPMADSHLSQQLSVMGAQIIFHAVNGGRDGSEWSQLTRQYHESNLRLRARAGRVWIVTADNATPEHLPSASPSGVVNPNGDFVRRAQPQGTQFFSYDIEGPS